MAAAALTRLLLVASAVAAVARGHNTRAKRGLPPGYDVYDRTPTKTIPSQRRVFGSTLLSTAVDSAVDKRSISSMVVVESEHETRPQCARLHDLPYCLDDDWYPRGEVNEAIGRETHWMDKIFVGIDQQSADNLVDGVANEQERQLDYSFYYGQDVFRADYLMGGMQPLYTHYRYRPDYYKNGGYVCPSYILYQPLYRALNAKVNLQ